MTKKRKFPDVCPAAVCSTYRNLNPLLAKTRIQTHPAFGIHLEAVALPTRLIVLADSAEFGINELATVATSHPLVRAVVHLVYAVPASRIPKRFHPMLGWFVCDEFKTDSETWLLFATKSPAAAVAKCLIDPNAGE